GDDYGRPAPAPTSPASRGAERSALPRSARRPAGRGPPGRATSSSASTASGSGPPTRPAGSWSRRSSACGTSSRRSSSPTRSGSTCSAWASTTARPSWSRPRRSFLRPPAPGAGTSRIRLTSAVTVLSSDDPVRVFQDFATLDLLSGGRAEIMAGRGSFIESFPLFGFDLEDYDELFAEKLGLLLALRGSERVTWSGQHRPPIADLAVYPRPLQDPLPVWVAVGGSANSAIRAGALGLPMALAIIGGEPQPFVPFAELHPAAPRR